jgi:multicomponent Na+:H+ antiporter subunit E
VILWNLILALAWAALIGQFSLLNFSVGYALGYMLLWIARRALGPSAYFQRTWRFVAFVGFYFWKLLLANLRVAYDVLTPRHYMRPGVVAIPLDARTDGEITLLANLMTLTPGTLSLDVSTDRRVLYLHALYIDDPEALRREIKEDYERRVLELMR